MRCDHMSADMPGRPRAEVDCRLAKRFIQIEWVNGLPVCWTGDTVEEVEQKLHAIPAWIEP